MTEKIYYVAAILSDTKLIINAGSKDGIRKGYTFNILDNDKSKKIELRDPVDENKILDTFYPKKQRVYAEIVHPNYSICSSIRVEEDIPAPAVSAFTSQLLHHTIGQKLNVDKEEIDDITSKYSNAVIHIGDKAFLDIK